MCEDNDIKIAGEKPSEGLKKQAPEPYVFPAGSAAAARKAGQEVAEEFIKAGSSPLSDGDMDDGYMMMQRLLLLSFTVTVGLERSCSDESLAGVAQKSFLDHTRRRSPELYSYTSDTGAFSFYFLAYRRGTDVVRRIGQTFAMLCSHDGDPIYQELGETLYCWFGSKIEQIVAKHKI